MSYKTVFKQLQMYNVFFVNLDFQKKDWYFLLCVSEFLVLMQNHNHGNRKDLYSHVSYTSLWWKKTRNIRNRTLSETFWCFSLTVYRHVYQRTDTQQPQTSRHKRCQEEHEQN